MVDVSYATRGIIGGTNWDDLYEWYRKTGQKQMPWVTAVPDSMRSLITKTGKNGPRLCS